MKWHIPLAFINELCCAMGILHFSTVCWSYCGSVYNTRQNQYITQLFKWAVHYCTNWCFRLLCSSKLLIILQNKFVCGIILNIHLIIYVISLMQIYSVWDWVSFVNYMSLISKKYCTSKVRGMWPGIFEVLKRAYQMLPSSYTAVSKLV